MTGKLPATLGGSTGRASPSYQPSCSLPRSGFGSGGLRSARFRRSPYRGPRNYGPRRAGAGRPWCISTIGFGGPAALILSGRGFPVRLTMQTLFDAPPKEPGLFGRFRQAVSKTREALTGQISDVLEGRREIDPELLEDLEMTLIGADLGVRTTAEILDGIRNELDRDQVSDPEAVRDLIADRMLAILEEPRGPGRAVAANPPEVVLFVGVNGVGKTTTIGKLAHRLKSEGRSVLLCAADTFRAAAAEQLVIWGQRANCPVIRQKSGADSSAVVYDALEAAKARGFDTVLVDTAGRLHNKAGLMRELAKIRRTVGRLVPGAPHQVLLVLDAVTGQNGLEQARKFTDTAGVTGLVLAKLDGTAKGGIVVAISRELGLPIQWAGVGERAHDLVAFDPGTFVRSLFTSSDQP